MNNFMFLKIEYNESTSDLSATELIVYSWIKDWCRNHQGKCTKTYTEILELLPNFTISEMTLKRSVWSLIDKGFIKRTGSKSDPVLTVYGDFLGTQTEQSEGDSKVQNEPLETDSKVQNEPFKSSNRTFQKFNLNLSTICKDHKLDQGKIDSLSESSDLSFSPEDIKAAEEAMRRHGL